MPANGVRVVNEETYTLYFVCTDDHCLGWTAQFADGQPIPLWSPAVPLDAEEPDRPMLLGLTTYGGSIYGVIDTHANLTIIQQQFFHDLKEGRTDYDRYLALRNTD